MNASLFELLLQVRQNISPISAFPYFQARREYETSKEFRHPVHSRYPHYFDFIALRPKLAIFQFHESPERFWDHSIRNKFDIWHVLCPLLGLIYDLSKGVIQSCARYVSAFDK